MADAEREVRIVITGKNMTGPEFEKARQALAGVRSQSDSVSAAARKLQDDWQKVRTSTGAADTSMTRLWSTMKSGAGLVGVTFGAGAVVGFASSVFSAAERIKDMSLRLGVGYEAAQRFKYAVEQGGGSVDDLEKALATMNRNLATGDRSTVSALNVVGLKLNDLRQMRPEDAFIRIADGVGQIENPMIRANVAQEIFGKSSLRLLPSMVEGFEKLGRSASVMSDDTVEGLEKAKQSWENFGNKVITVSGNVIGWVMRTREAAVSGYALQQKAAREAIATGESYESIMARLQSAQHGVTEATKQGAVQQAVAATVTRNWGAELAAARDQVDGLSRARRAEILTAIEAGASTQDLTAQYGLSDLAVRVLKDGTKELEQRQAQQARAADEAAKKTEQLVAQHAKLFGLDTIQQAEALVTIIGDFPDAWRMTDQAQRASLDTLNAALAAYKRLGMEAPQHVRRLAQELEFLAKIGPGGNAGIQAAMPGTSVGLGKYAPSLSGVGPGGNAGIQSWLAGLGGSTGLGAAPGQNPLQLLFGMTSTQFGAQLGQTITGAVMGGGNVGEAAGSFVGQSIGANIAKSSGKALEGVFGKTVGSTIAAAIPGIGALLGPLAGKLVGKVVSLFTGGEGAKANDLRDQLKAKFGDAAGAGLQAAVDKYKGLASVQQAYDQFMRGGSRESVQSAFDSLTRAMQDTDAVLQKYGLTLEDTKSPQDRLAASMKALNADMLTLKGLGFTNQQMAKGMAKELNDLVRAALDAGGKIPASMQPMLEELIRGGLLADDLAARMLGIPAKTKAPWQEMQTIAEEFGIDIDKLGVNFQQSKLIDGAQTLAEKWSLLVENGADVGAVMDGMKSKANEYLIQAKRWGLEVPASMKPMLQAMLDAGLLTDENGDKLKDLEGIKFGQTIADQFDPLVDALRDLIDMFTNDFPASLEEARRNASRGIDVPYRTGTEGTGNPPDPAGDEDSDGVPNQYDSYPYDDTRYASGGIAAGRQVATIAEQGRKEIVGDGEFMAAALGKALRSIAPSQDAREFSSSVTTTQSGPYAINVYLEGEKINARIERVAGTAMSQGRTPVPSRAVRRQVPRG